MSMIIGFVVNFNILISPVSPPLSFSFLSSLFFSHHPLSLFRVSVASLIDFSVPWTLKTNQSGEDCFLWRVLSLSLWQGVFSGVYLLSVVRELRGHWCHGKLSVGAFGANGFGISISRCEWTSRKTNRLIWWQTDGEREREERERARAPQRDSGSACSRSRLIGGEIKVVQCHLRPHSGA